MYSATSSQYSREIEPSRRPSLIPSPLNLRRLINRNLRSDTSASQDQELASVSNGTWASTPTENHLDPMLPLNVAYELDAEASIRGRDAVVSGAGNTHHESPRPITTRLPPLQDRRPPRTRGQPVGGPWTAQRAGQGTDYNKSLPAPPPRSLYHKASRPEGPETEEYHNQLSRPHQPRLDDQYFELRPVDRNGRSLGSTPSLKDLETKEHSFEQVHGSGRPRNPLKSFFSPFTTPETTQTGTSTRTSKSGNNTKCLIIAIIAAVLVTVIVSVVPAVVVTQKHHRMDNSHGSSPSGTSTLTSPTAAPTVYNAGLSNKSLQVDTPLAPIAFVANTSDWGQSPGVQNYGIYYQNKCGNVKGVQNSGSWVPYGTPFTDSTNITGLSCVAFFNQTVNIHQTYCFYVGTDSHVRDKMLNPVDNTFEPGSLLYRSVIVNQAPASALDGDPSSQPADGYSLLALYSENWADVGAGIRVFHHASNSSGAYVQEHILDLAKNNWTIGAAIGLGEVLPVSKLVGAVDEQSGMARLMYATAGDNSTDADAAPKLQQWYFPMRNGTNSTSSPLAAWTRGQSFSGLIQHGSSAFALAATSGSTFLYYVAPLNSTGPALQIRELAMPAANSSEAIDMGAAQTVAVPDWLAADTGDRSATLYAPIAAVGAQGAVSVFWAEGVVDTLAGYDRLMTAQRQLGQSWEPASYGSAPGQVQIDVDKACFDV